MEKFKGAFPRLENKLHLDVR